MGVATVAAVGAAAVSAYGASQQANAARSAGQAADRASQDWMSYTRGQQKEALASYDKYVPAEQAAIDKAIQSQTQNVARQQKLVDSIDPALLEAGKQSFQLLQGQSAPVLQNMKDQRQLQRQSMIDTLRQQLGPGAETSTIGMHQLQKFDAETSNQLSGAQQAYLQQVSNLALNGGQTLSQTLSGVNSTLAQLGTQYGNIGATRAGIITGATSAGNAAAQSAVANAGGAYAGQAANGALYQNIGSGLGQVAGIYGASQNSTPGSNPSPGGQTSADYNPSSANWQNYAQAQQGGNPLASSVVAPQPVARAPVGTYAPSGGYSGPVNPPSPYLTGKF